MQRQEIPEEEEPLQGKMIETVQRQEIPEEEEPLQTKRENNTGMPDNLKAGVESLSGIDISDVRVHYNSSKPAEVGALAYTQGTDIHVALGQERYLPHEAWHVVQQAQGRVRPTMQTKDGVEINDDKGLENEADIMGIQAHKRTIAIKEELHQGKYKEVDSPRSQSLADASSMQFPSLPRFSNYIQATKESDEYATCSIIHGKQSPSKKPGTVQKTGGDRTIMPDKPKDRPPGTDMVKYIGAVPIGGRIQHVWWNYVKGQYIGANGQVLENITSERYFAEGVGWHAFNIAEHYVKTGRSTLVKGTEFSSVDRMRPAWKDQVEHLIKVFKEQHRMVPNLKERFGGTDGDAKNKEKILGRTSRLHRDAWGVKRKHREHDLIQITFPKVTVGDVKEFPSEEIAKLQEELRLPDDQKIPVQNFRLPRLDPRTETQATAIADYVDRKILSGFIQYAFHRVKLGGRIRIVVINNDTMRGNMQQVLAQLPRNIAEKVTQTETHFPGRLYHNKEIFRGHDDLNYEHERTGMAKTPDDERVHGYSRYDLIKSS